ncbi:MAG: hypothetical protein HY665_06075, partial [Chloroflexi bacterium]|nr:hypothetical protein [Chloroflexota bacterium]
PAILGDNASLQKFNTAQGLWDYVTVAMPFDAPGSLSQEQYLQEVSFLLLENKFVSPDRIIRLEELPNINLRE